MNERTKKWTILLLFVEQRLLPIRNCSTVSIHSLEEKNPQSLSHLNCGLQIRQIRVQSITACGEYCKALITDLDELKQRLRTERAKLDCVDVIPHIGSVSTTSQIQMSSLQQHFKFHKVV